MTDFPGNGEFRRLQTELIECRRCPRLVEWREKVAVNKRAAYSDQDYWARPVPMLGDPSARLLIVGLAPGAHGSNRTGQMFTSDRSGEWLFRSLHEKGFANQPVTRRKDDGMRLLDAAITSIVRCAPPQNRPTAQEKKNCSVWIGQELDLFDRLEVVVALGGMAFDQILRLGRGRGWIIPVPRPRFSHGVEVDTGEVGPLIIGCYHPSQQNTFTGKLTREMLDQVFARARAFLSA
ncbi:MAG: uracil-DNA glycosylase [Acidimicrobiia bacterium]|nr:uracil-DNA glycosylase [bacterium]MCY3580903.1 uracil-DNA glycosylase [bacterium]MDE0644373.1 uracil-DNA glycosylase [bacterium]MXZ07411.1 uracil-DNA glycosylase [Acidimicrobiia bacterium]MYH55485.1 uracil-DNA glycosylase [Acidimicrobiia bacterium]